MHRIPALFALLLLSLPAAAAATAGCPRCAAEADGPPSPWSGRGELGFASARGNNLSESLNTRLELKYSEDRWIHGLNLFGLRARAEYRVAEDNGTMQRERRTTANRFNVGATSALELDDHRQFTTALRLEHDQFASFDRQHTASVGYGTRLMDGQRTQLDLQVGPGYRQVREADTGASMSGPIGRGFVGVKLGLTANTELTNQLLVESGPANTFAQNDFGVSVAMNSQLALKAGIQARRNSATERVAGQTDTLTTMNVVYRFR